VLISIGSEIVGANSAAAAAVGCAFETESWRLEAPGDEADVETATAL